MPEFNVTQARTRFSELVRLAVSGEEVVISKHGKPLLKLVPVAKRIVPREPGSGKGQVLYISPDFDASTEACKDYA